MKIIIYADPQIKNHPEFLRTDENGLSNWVKIAVNCFDQMVKYALFNNIDFMVGLGDMTEMKNYVDNSVLVTVNKILNKIANADILHYWVVGNHDFSNPNFPLVGAFDGIKNFHIFSEPRKSPNGLFHIVPWESDITKYQDTIFEMNYGLRSSTHPIYLFTHQTIVPMFNAPYLEHVFEKEHEVLYNYQYVFSGHIHNPCQIGNVVYVGSMFQTDFGEEGEQKRFIVLDANSGTFESVNFDYPKLVTIEGTNIDKDINGCYVRFKIKEKTNIQKLKDDAKKAGAIDSKIILEKKKIVRNIRISREEINKKDLKDLVLDYCEEQKVDGENIWGFCSELLKEK